MTLTHLSLMPVYTLCILLAMLPEKARGTDVIDISKPVSKSITPIGVYWNFDEGTIGEPFPDIARDSSESGIEGHLLPRGGEKAPVYSEGRFNTAIHLKGAGARTDDRNPRVHWIAGDSGDDAKLDMIDTSFTAGAWVRLTGIEEGEDRRMILFERGESAGNRSYYNLVLQQNESGAWALVMGIGGETPANVASSERTEVLNDLQWHHVAVTYRVTPEANLVSFWVDGQPLGSEMRTTARIGEVSDPRERQLSVGERNVGYFYGFKGMIDDFFITTGEYSFTMGD